MHLPVIEDDRSLGRALTRLLEADRHVVELAVLGRDGLELAEAGDFDALILDVGLPDMSGLLVARSLPERGSSIPVLMLTARDSVPDRVSGLDAGADDYLVKPFAYAELSARLRALLRRGREGGRDVRALRAIRLASRRVAARELPARPLARC